MPNSILRYWGKDTSDPIDAMFEVAPILMHSIDANGVLLKVSNFWAEKLGYEPEEMLGRKSTDFLTEGSRKKAEQIVLPKFFKTGIIDNVEYEFVRKNGDVLPVLMSAVAQTTAEGEFVRSLAVLFDNSENRRLALELNHSLRMKALGQLVGGVAHDFNNILTVIKGNTEFLRDSPDDPDRANFIRDTWRAAERGATLTQMLLSYGQKSNLAPKRTNLNSIVQEMDQMLRRVLPNKLQLSTVSGGGLWEVDVDQHLLETALMNIVSNARDAMPMGGKITIETCNVRISENYIAGREEDILPGRYVMLAVSDTGEGIEREIVDRIFEPYFTTKEFGKGSGLGLAMVFGFVKQSGGTIRVYTEKGFGSTFKLYFPATHFDVKPNERVEWSAENTPSPMAEVLVVEDEPDVRRVLVRLIRKAGYSVSEAHNGDEAFSMMSFGHRPKILVTDIIMPGALQGPELADRAREIVGGLQVILVSGRPKEAAIHGEGMNEADLLISKPIDTALLLSKIRESADKFTPEE